MTDAGIRAERARQILEDELFQEAFAAVEAAAIDGLAAIHLFDSLSLQASAAMLRAVREVKAQMEQVMMTGQIAEKPTASVA